MTRGNEGGDRVSQISDQRDDLRFEKGCIWRPVVGKTLNVVELTPLLAHRFPARLHELVGDVDTRVAGVSIVWHAGQPEES